MNFALLFFITLFTGILATDTIPPVITLDGDNPMNVEAGSDYADPGATAYDNIDGDLTPYVTIINNVNTAAVGTYTVTYFVSDAAGNAAVKAVRAVIVVDTTPPVITLVGVNSITIEAGSDYADPGATAYDNVDGPTAVTVVGVVNTAAVGTYTVTYSVSDAAGNAAEAVRAVIVVDTTPPVITLVGVNSITIEAGSVYADPGATAYDIVDGPTAVTVSGNVNTAAVGTYTLTYSVSDAAGNAAVKVRIVTVVSQPSSAEIKNRYNAGDCNGFITLCGNGTIWKNGTSPAKHCEIDTNTCPKALDAYAAIADALETLETSADAYESAAFQATNAAFQATNILSADAYNVDALAAYAAYAAANAYAYTAYADVLETSANVDAANAAALAAFVKIYC
jgi:hypothetical protein